MGIAGIGFASKGEAEKAAVVLRKLFKCHTRVVDRGNGFWAVRTSYSKELT